jgi:hypothetical protein
VSTADELVVAAFREGNLKPISEPITDAEKEEALARLNNIITALFGHDLGEHLRDWAVPPPQRTAPVSAQYPLAPYTADLPSGVWPYPPGNTRLLVSITGNATIYLQQKPNDGARLSYVDVGSTATLTVDANGRLIDDALSITLVAADSPKTWFYRGDLGEWQALIPLNLGSSSPFPDEFDDLLICRLAMRLSGRYGNEPRSDTINTYKEMLVKLKARYKQPTAEVGGGANAPTTEQSYANGNPNSWM